VLDLGLTDVRHVRDAVVERTLAGVGETERVEADVAGELHRVEAAEGGGE